VTLAGDIEAYLPATPARAALERDFKNATAQVPRAGSDPRGPPSDPRGVPRRAAV
jgi:hypothetical protein